jgi:hypothetical protein
MRRPREREELAGRRPQPLGEEIHRFAQRGEQLARLLVLQGHRVEHLVSEEREMEQVIVRVLGARYDGDIMKRVGRLEERAIEGVSLAVATLLARLRLEGDFGRAGEAVDGFPWQLLPRAPTRALGAGQACLPCGSHASSVPLSDTSLTHRRA